MGKPGGRRGLKKTYFLELDTEPTKSLIMMGMKGVEGSTCLTWQVYEEFELPPERIGFTKNVSKWNLVVTSEKLASCERRYEIRNIVVQMAVPGTSHFHNWSLCRNPHTGKWWELQDWPDTDARVIPDVKRYLCKSSPRFEVLHVSYERI